MNKKILFGSILAVVLILMMPSIPAIEDEAYSDFVEKIKSLDDDVMLPLLYALVMFNLQTRHDISSKLIEISSTYNGHAYWPFEVHNPIIFTIGFVLALRSLFGLLFWIAFSDIFRLDWDI